LVDNLSKERRSWNMSRIRGRDTRSEIFVRSLLHSLGYRFRLHRKDLPGKPDIVLPKHRTVIFVHGCFWHRHLGCRYAYTPKSRVEFWTNKFSANLERDAKVRHALEQAGWQVLVVWECELRDVDRLAKRLVSAISSHKT
jgi:DNA mismatch endonuclease, patch repair protein